jgi:hypothetical protein
MKTSTFLLALAVIVSCKSKQTSQDNKNVLAIAKYDTAISKNQAFREMESQKEVVDIDAMDSTLKRSSNVNYCISSGDNNPDNCSNEYNCTASFFRSDTLNINIDFNSGLGGMGILLHYKNGAFDIRPNYWTDQYDEFSAKPIFIIKEQSLVLDKKQYKVGDSLYGKTNFYITETKEGKTKEYSGQGYFRAKVVSIE